MSHRYKNIEYKMIRTNNTLGKTFLENNRENLVKDKA